ncbi:hypothetical protein FJQ98_16425 [Lysinibacillus agricola]|uniref:Uncharacterized protein n=1 Tax=Lysinibacillus agricola TaxID=2590012 RepID=A0ABX7ALP1_9BACI|nr:MULTISPECIES: hypothetical protein [Lysinibacillus]KOS61482.1 hypothetical protein AN161_17990 [Lysinibacillus sp. FJAT-14222]QQP10831.1 hypothetical protein FJQ98_16425 [Lysinibacillus agricola]
MKPSTHKKIKKFKSKSLNTYYKIMYPLAWLIDKFEKYKYERLKRKVTPEYAAKLLSKEIYKYQCKSIYDNESYVVIADYVDTEEYIDPYRAIKYFTNFKSKARKISKILNRKDINESFFNKVMEEFNKINEYTFVKVIDNNAQYKWGRRS